MTKIAFVSNNNMTGENTINDSYVRPDQIIKRIELTKMSTEATHKLFSKTEIQNDGTGCEKTKSGKGAKKMANGLDTL